VRAREVGLRVEKNFLLAVAAKVHRHFEGCKTTGRVVRIP
jgi:hypothetical protein